VCRLVRQEYEKFVGKEIPVDWNMHAWYITDFRKSELIQLLELTHLSHKKKSEVLETRNQEKPA